MNYYKNANDILSRNLGQKSMKEIYTTLCQSVNSSNESSFVSSMQNYITRIGLCLQDCFVDIKMGGNTCLYALTFLCKAILRDNTLYNLMRATGINEAGNTIKHYIGNVDTKIESVLMIYNKMIDQLVSTTGLQALKICKVSKKKNLRDVPIFGDKRSTKCGQLTQVKYELLLSPYYKIDPYTKKIETMLTLRWPECNKDRLVDVTVTNTKTGKVICSQTAIDISNRGQKTLTISVPETRLDKRVLNLSVNIVLWTNEDKIGVSGHLFWKDYYHYNQRKDIAQTTVEVSQLMKNEMNGGRGNASYDNRNFKQSRGFQPAYAHSYR